MKHNMISEKLHSTDDNKGFIQLEKYWNLLDQLL